MLREYKGQKQLDFLEPYDRITSSIDNWCLGSREVNFLEGDHNTHNWHFYIDKQYENENLVSQKLMLEREDKEFIYEVYDFEDIKNYEHYTGEDIIIIEEMCGDFDQTMRPYCFFKVNHKWYRLYYERTERKVAELRQHITNAKCLMDTKTKRDLGRSDVCLFYVNKDTQNICVAYQSTDFRDEVVLFEKVYRKSYIQKVGLDKNDEYVIIQWR